MQMSLHMPLNTSLDSEAFYAYDKPVWIDIVLSIHSFCLENIEDKAMKKLIPFRKDVQMAETHLLLVAKTTKQVLLHILLELVFYIGVVCISFGQIDISLSIKYILL